MIDASAVSAIVVTRGDVDLGPILATLPFSRVTVWDNSKKPYDYKTLGRHIAAMAVDTEVVYHQDDDVVFRNFDQLLSAWEPGRAVVNMPSPWWERSGYDKTGQVMFGAGSLVEHRLTTRAIGEYLAEHPWDDDFLVYCDCILGFTVPSRRIDVGYEILPCATSPGRINTMLEGRPRREKMDARGADLRSRTFCRTDDHGFPIRRGIDPGETQLWDTRPRVAGRA